MACILSLLHSLGPSPARPGAGSQGSAENVGDANGDAHGGGGASGASSGSGDGGSGLLSKANMDSIMHRMAEQKLPVTEMELREYYEAFAEFDRDDSGNISTGELGHVMRSLGENPTSMELEV